ncbi:alpha/beta hydrolase [Cryobacterium sp. Y57]|uniref:alpha/beta hydrolase n=1 Tax=Cryobacterium sp. Y57 TaxID=2048287 RepID=UPI000CE42D94|nr:alpha/beta hydrolase [Cryobacterium sp. Y57]
MNSKLLPAVPLDDVAVDAVDLIRAFRDAGAVSFQDQPLDQSRAAYEAGCAANGVPLKALERVEDLHCEVNGGSILLRHYRPEGNDSETARAVVVYLHGGGWVIGSVETHDRLCRYLAAVSGLDVVSVDYRLAPEYPFPTPLEDCIAALTFVSVRAGEYGWDPHRIIVAGDSAGGNLATVLASDPGCTVSGSTIIGQLLLYPVANLLHESDSYARITDGFPLTAGSMRWFRSLYLADPQFARDLRVSPGLRQPAELAEHGAPPAFVVTVGLDPLADEGVEYAGLLARAGAPVEHHHLPRHSHGLFTAAGVIPTGARLLNRAANWLVELTG